MDEPGVRSWHCSAQTGHRLDVPCPSAASAIYPLSLPVPLASERVHRFAATVRLAFGGAGLAGARVPSGFAAAGFIRIAKALWQFAKALAEHADNAKADLLVVASGPAPGPCCTRFAGSRRGRETAAL
jgi:hypothetical protein